MRRKKNRMKTKNKNKAQMKINKRKKKKSISMENKSKKCHLKENYNSKLLSTSPNINMNNKTFTIKNLNH